jgi:peptidoglycan/LPS O-acetylase OafA/YrhL
MMSAIQAPARPIRYVELDSLRGLAALTVVLQHLQKIWEMNTPPTSASLRAFLDLVRPFGSEAVMLFFVLSGFVLSLPAVAGKPQPYFTFVTRRVFRIYIPYLAALAASVAGAFWLHGIVTKADWFHAFWSGPVTWRLVWQHVAFLGIYDTSMFDTPIWSLVHEMRISLFFPLLCWLVLRLRSMWSFAIAAGLTVSAIVIVKKPFYIDSSFADSLHFAGLFGAWFRHQRRPAKLVVGAVSLCLFLFAGPLLAGYAGGFLGRSLFLSSQWITALGAGGLMIVSMNSDSCKHILSWRPIHFLGQVSYSLYLWHFVVLLYCVHLLYDRVPLPAILCLVFALSMLVSWFSYRWIEVPSMNLGRRLSNVFQAPSGK